MPRGKRSSASRGKGKQNKDSSKKAKVDPKPEQGTEDPSETEEVWDVVHVYQKGEEPRECRLEGCGKRAVTTWATNLSPNDKWDMCEDCQLKDFGGWPEGVEPPDDSDGEDDDHDGRDVKHEVNQDQDQDEQCEAKVSDGPKVECNENGTESTPPTAGDTDMTDANNDASSVATPMMIDEPRDKHDAKDTLNLIEKEAEESSTPKSQGREVETVVETAGVSDPSPEQGTDGSNQEREREREREREQEQEQEQEQGSSESAEKNKGEDSTNIQNEGSNDTNQEESDPHHAETNVEIDARGDEGEDRTNEEKTKDEGAEEAEKSCDDVKSLEGDRDESEGEEKAGSITEGDQNDGDDEEDEEEEQWDLKKVLSFAELNKEGTIKCSTEDCPLSACSVWISSEAPTTKWYSCIDCQENDFEGWPPLEEMPITTMTLEHQQVMAKKCSRQKKPAMPALLKPPTSPDPKKKGGNGATAVTPPAKRAKGMAKPSAGALAMHKKWQDAAEAMGGKDARIVVSKSTAKKLIFDHLFDAFRPMNITQIYKELKAVVPSPVLNSCLKDMAFDKIDLLNQFVDSDDDEEASPKPKKKKDDTDTYSSSLFFKAGKTQNTNLYYTNHTKLKGMDRDERDKLTSELASAKAEKSTLEEIVKSTIAAAVQLASEPTNEEISMRFEEYQKDVNELREKLEAAKALKVNEKHKQRTKRKIDTMASQWRRRKRICMDFLISLEENTEGAVTVKKCLSGDGQIVLESDEFVVKAALKYRKDQRSRPAMSSKRLGGSLGKSSKTNNVSQESLADEDFVAVMLDSQNTIKRIYADEDSQADAED